MDDREILAEACAKRDRALAEAEKLSAFIETLLELRPNLKPSGIFQSRVASAAGTIVATGTVRGEGISRGSIAETEGAAIRIIQKHGHGITTKDLLPLIEAEGIAVGGKDPLATLSARLSRSPRLDNIRPIGWTVRGASPPNVMAEFNSLWNADDVLPENVTSSASAQTNDASEPE